MRGITKINGLLWQDNEAYTSKEKKAYDDNKNYGKVGHFNYAKNYCKRLRLGGYKNWRLPNVNEIRSLFLNGYDVSHQSDFQQGHATAAGYDHYWSSTTVVYFKDYYNKKYADYAYVSDHMEHKASYLHVRCVRGGQ